MTNATAKLAALEKAGHPVVRIAQNSVENIGQEFFRFEIATAIAGAVLGINPFDQPDVEASKVKTRELTAAFEKTGALPPETPVCSGKIDQRSTPTRRMPTRCARPAPMAASKAGCKRISRASAPVIMLPCSPISHRDEDNAAALAGYAARLA